MMRHRNQSQIATSCYVGTLRKEMSNVEKTNSEFPVENQQAVIDQFQKQLQKLEKQLQFEKDRNYALNTLIDIAEEQGIRIRKKSGVKR